MGRLDLSVIVQTTLFEAFQHDAHVADDPNERLTWLRRIFLNNLLDEIRRLKTQKRDIRLERSLDRSASKLRDWLTNHESTPSVKAVRAEQAQQLRQAIGKLPADQRRAIELHHFEELPLATISRNMGKSKGAVAALIYRGMQTIKGTFFVD